MSEHHIRQARGVDYWIDRCDLAENQIDDFTGAVNMLLVNMSGKGPYSIESQAVFERAVAMLARHDNVDASHLGLNPFRRCDDDTACTKNCPAGVPCKKLRAKSRA